MPTSLDLVPVLPSGSTRTAAWIDAPGTPLTHQPSGFAEPKLGGSSAHYSSVNSSEQATELTYVGDPDKCIATTLCFSKKILYEQQELRKLMELWIQQMKDILPVEALQNEKRGAQSATQDIDSAKQQFFNGPGFMEQHKRLDKLPTVLPVDQETLIHPSHPCANPDMEEVPVGRCCTGVEDKKRNTFNSNTAERIHSFKSGAHAGTQGMPEKAKTVKVEPSSSLSSASQATKEGALFEDGGRPCPLDCSVFNHQEVNPEHQQKMSRDSTSDDMANATTVPGVPEPNSPSTGDALHKKALERRGSLDSCDSHISVTRCTRRRSLSRQRSLRILATSDDSRMAAVVHSKFFTAMCVVVIVISIFCSAWDADAAVQVQMGSKDSHPSWLGLFDESSPIFVVLLLIELSMRIAADGRWFFLGPHWQWNLFDSLVFICALVGSKGLTGIKLVQLPNAIVLRIFRVVSLCREANMARFTKVFHTLRLLMVIIIQSIPQLMWSMLLLLLVMVLFGIVFLNGVAQEPDSKPARHTAVMLERHFGSMPRMLLTLFMAVTGGMDWHLFATPLMQVNATCSIFFIFFIAFVQICALNVVTGVFVDSAFQMAQRDREVAVQEHLDKRNSYVKELKQIFLEADTDESGTLSWEEFKEHAADERVVAYLHSLELDGSQARGLFKLLDVDGDDEVDINEFVTGCLRFKGTAKSIDVCTLLYEVRRLKRKLTNHFQQVETQLYGQEEKTPKQPPSFTSSSKSIRSTCRRKSKGSDSITSDSDSSEFAVASVSMSLSLSENQLASPNSETGHQTNCGSTSKQGNQAKVGSMLNGIKTFLS